MVLGKVRNILRVGYLVPPFGCAGHSISHNVDDIDQWDFSRVATLLTCRANGTCRGSFDAFDVDESPVKDSQWKSIVSFDSKDPSLLFESVGSETEGCLKGLTGQAGNDSKSCQHGGP